MSLNRQSFVKQCRRVDRPHEAILSAVSYPHLYHSSANNRWHSTPRGVRSRRLYGRLSYTLSMVIDPITGSDPAAGSPEGMMVRDTPFPNADVPSLFASSVMS